MPTFEHRAGARNSPERVEIRGSILAVEVSVVIPTYNRAKLLAEALASVKAQTRPPLEIIVVDDGSTDGTRALLEAMGEKVRPIFQANHGAAAARNRGIEAARGDWIAFLDSDDLWEPRKLEAQARALAADPTCRLAIVDSRAVDLEGRPIPRRPRSLHAGTVTAALFRSTFVHTPAVLVEAALLRALGGFDPTLRVAEDYDLWLRASLHTPFALVSEPLFIRRVHAGSLAHAPDPRNGDDKCRVLERFAALPEARRVLSESLIRSRLAQAHWQAARGHLAAASPAGAMPHLTRVLALKPLHWRARWHAWRAFA
jgi:glycosyltransferase involved in cell wall biosynthesis